MNENFQIRFPTQINTNDRQETPISELDIGNKLPDTEWTNFTTDLREWLKPCEQNIHQAGLNLINTRLWLDQLSHKYGRPITIDTVPADEWQTLHELYDSYWFMGIYTPSEASRNNAKKYTDQYRYALPDINPDLDVAASPFAVPEYTPNPAIAKDWVAWDRMVDTLHDNGKQIIIDFVPNHVALDHPWAAAHPEYFVEGTAEQYEAHPDKYYPVQAADGAVHFIAYGKDPNWDEWRDTLQLNYGNPEVHREMTEILLNLVQHADGVRCDMAMLVNPGTFLRTWGNHLTDEQKQYISQTKFWENAVPLVKARARLQGKEDFAFIAEAYWDKDELGKHFDYIYNKDLYDQFKKIVHDKETPVYLRNHLKYLLTAARNGRHYRDILFTENHDEERARSVFGREPSKAAAVLSGIMPESIFLLNQGQDEGRRIRPPMQINRMPDEPLDSDMQEFYKRLLALKHSRLFQQGEWDMAKITEANASMMALQVQEPSSATPFTAVVCTNFGSSFASCRIPDIDTVKTVAVYNLTDGTVINNADLKRDGGLYVGLTPWETQVVYYR